MVAARYVYPSAGAFATESAPTIPFAPGRFSTTTGCFHDSLSFCAIFRVMMSVAPPGGNGTTILIGLPGYDALDCAIAAAVASANAPVAIAPINRRIVFTRSYRALGAQRA